MKRKILAGIIAFILLLSLAGCGSLPGQTKGMHIICTVFPQYDWVRNILGEELENNTLTLLMDNGADLHNYQATAEDLMNISECDLFIYVGGVSDQWAENALKDPINKNRKTIKLLDTNPLCSAHQHEENDAHDHEIDECDEHIWLSLKRAELISQKIADALGELDPENKEIYKSNAKNYCGKLHELDKKFENMVARATYKTLLVPDRFPFLYLTSDYGLSYEAAFEGCSTETQASFKTIAHLSETLDNLKLPYLLVTESANQSVAQSVINNSKEKSGKILTLNSIQSVTMKQIEEGASYLDLMKKNYKTLKLALGAN